MRSQANLFTKTRSYAEWSPDRRYRYRLERVWDSTRPVCMYLMLNPSIADEEVNDPTVERCQRRAVANDYGALVVANIFALVSTDPKGLKACEDPVGPANDTWIRMTAQYASVIVCAWGTHGRLRNRGREVVELLTREGHADKLRCLSTNADGSPKHPLYVPYAQGLQRFP